MNEIKKPREKWYLAKLNPPDNAQCKKFAEFMRSQQDNPQIYPLEKDSIPEWKLRKNRIRKGFLSLMITCKEKKIVSSCSITPKKIWDGKNFLFGGEIGDTFTDNKFQRNGMFVDLVNATRESAQGSGLKIIYGLPNSLSLPGYLKKLNFEIKENFHFQNYTLILEPKVLGDRLKRYSDNYIYNFIINIIFCSSIISKIWNFIIKLSTKNQTNLDLEVRFETAFNEDYNLLWEKIRDGICFANARNSSYLNWRYCDSPFDFKILSVRKKGDLKGYIIFLVDPNYKNDKVSYLQIVDWMFNPKEYNSVGIALMKEVVNFSMKNSIDIISSHSSKNSPVQLPWNRFGFISRSGSKPLIIHNNINGSRIIDNHMAWHFTLADTDAF